MSIEGEAEFNEGDFKENLPPNLLELSTDLSTILKTGLQSDVVLRVIGNDVKDIKCHKAILSIRSKWFSQKIRQTCTPKNTLIKINEKNQILNAVLTYIYTGNLKLLESLSIPLIDLHNAAKKYGLTRLEAIVTDIIKSDRILDKTKSTEFLWNVVMDRNNYISCICPALKDFTLYGSDKWGLEFQPLTLGDGTSASEIYLTREIASEAHNITHIINISIYFVNLCSSTLLFSKEISITEDGKYKMFIFSASSEQTENPSETTFTLSCELKVCGKVGDIESFQLKGIYRRHISNELFSLSQDMQQMLKDRKYTDISIKQIGSTNLWQLHSYIINARSGMPIPIIGKLGDVASFESVTWQSFMHFLYTGQTRYLDDHMRVVYNAFRKWNLKEPAQKYESILTKYLNISNAFGILCDSVTNGDADLMANAAQFLACNSGFLSDSESWISIARDNEKRVVFQDRFN